MMNETEMELSEMTRIVKELIGLAQTPEQVEFLSNWNQTRAIIDTSKMQEALANQREQIKRLEYDLKKEGQIYLKVIRSISNGENDRW